MKPVDVQIITYAPTVFYHCQHCELTFGQMGFGDRIHREQARSALPEDLREDFAVLSDSVHELLERFGERLRVRVVDAASIEGFWKSLRFRAHKLPAVIVDGRRHDAGKHYEDLAALVEQAVVTSNGGAAKEVTERPG
jgi:hypothetical protein